MTLRISDPAYEYEILQEDIDAALARVLRKGAYVADEEVAAFEKEFAAFCGVRFGVATASGTIALVVGLKALGLNPGDEVITAPYTAISTAAAIVHSGGRVVFADVKPETLCLDPDHVRSRITARTRAILPVHLHGQMAEMDPLMDLAAEYGLKALEDAALAAGAEYRQRRAGSIGHAGVISFAPSKLLGGLGWGGILVTDDKGLAVRGRQLAGFGPATMPDEPRERLNGYNAQMNSLQAAGLRVKLACLEGWIRRRREISARYDQACDRLDISRLHPPVWITPSPRVYVIRVADREAAMAELQSVGVDASPHFVPPLHLRELYAGLGYARGDFPVAERAADELICLPVHPHLTDEDVDRIIAGLEALP